ncbi:hypothetical protein E3N88_44639 [Mikania micrantha]|uniref:RNase III domain-containing protein n=1 Tax=Mikania micrantha TaxID=192012 RepID=A0A5N6LBG1_9ASTR|nr:hypothetical protein E3N88_44639 [Mikania micrantha]
MMSDTSNCQQPTPYVFQFVFRYQLDVFKVAMMRNTIAYFDSGKHRPLVDFYHGSKVMDIDGKKVDEWDSAVWEHEINKNQEFYFKSVSKPKVFWHDCIPGVSSTGNSEAQITALERTTKRKELHGTIPIQAVCGTWGDKLDDVDFYAYTISFVCSLIDVKYSSFVLLLESKLDDDVANLEMKLYLVSKFVNCKVSSCVKLHLNAEQVAKGKCFQELFFNGIFSKLYVGSKHSKEPRDFLLETDQKLWTSSYMYLLLPLESIDPFKIGWKLIDSCVSAIEFIKKSSVLSVKKLSVDPIIKDPESTRIIHFANKPVSKDDVANVVVLAIHTGKIYTVHEVLQDETAHSSFDGNSKKFSSFENYFKQKYEINLKYPGQNMLLLKQSHRAHNLLVDFNGEGLLNVLPPKVVKCKVNTGRQRYYARLPPELLFIIDARLDVVKSIYLLPSLMHRLESLMLASQLREEITGHMTDIHVSSSLILEAITTLRCNESFSMERLELLGDSVLKYAVSCDLIFGIQINMKDSCLLHDHVKFVIPPCMIWELAVGYRDIAFDPTRWTAPGQLPLRLYPCDHGVETLEVPIDAKYQTDEPKFLTGKRCDRGHRWLGSKSISDCVEALVGAYFVAGGLTGALHCLLLEAITHASNQEQGVGYCYERLEFLGDSVLDLLITRHLFNKHLDIDPGELTDLRSASVNNENFAYVAVRRNLHPYLQYRSGDLQTQISDYVKFAATSSTDTNSLQTKKSPKALGDLVESITGAVLLDTQLNFDEVWRIFEPLLTPIVTPEKLELPPLRELLEFCDSKGYFIKTACRSQGDAVIAELSLQLEDALLVAEGTGPTRKIARGQAALKLLSQLQNQGQDNKDGEISNKNIKGNDTTRSKITHFDPQPAVSTFIVDECLMNNESDSKVEIPVLKSINTKKGGPRSTLYELCRKMQWPMPILTSSEQKSKSRRKDHLQPRKDSFKAHLRLTRYSHASIYSQAQLLELDRWEKPFILMRLTVLVVLQVYFVGSVLLC